MEPAVRQILLDSRRMGADLWLDFVNGRYWQANEPAGNLLTVSRASDHYGESSAGVWSLFTSDTPVITDKGLWVFEARTNGIRNNSMQGVTTGALGSGGVAPTNWTLQNPTGLTWTVVGAGTTQGMDYIDLRLSGTAGSTGGSNQYFEASTVIAASNAQAWTTSMFAQLVSGSFSGAVTCTVGVRKIDSGGSSLGDLDGSVSITSTMQRLTSTVTTDNASTAYVRPYIVFRYTNGAAIDFTIRLCWPQCELGSFVTPPIRTTSAAVTRAASVVTLRTPLVYGSAYSALVEVVPHAPTGFGTSQRLVSIDDGSSTNQAFLRRENATGAMTLTNTSGGVTTSATGAALAQNATGKMAGAFAPADQVGVYAGAAVAIAATFPVGVSTTRLGCTSAAAGFTNGLIRSVAIWSKSRLPTSLMQRLTV